LKRWASGFYSTPQVDELPDRNSENKGTQSQYLHTFLQHFKLQREGEILYRKFITSSKKNRVTEAGTVNQSSQKLLVCSIVGFHSGVRRENSYIYITKG